MGRSTLWALGVLGCLAGGASAQEFGFDSPVTIPVGSWADSVAVGDVNGDGRDDVALATSFYFDDENDYSVFIFLQRPDATLAPPVRLRFSESTSSTDVLFADLDNDGNEEVVVCHAGGLTTFRWTGGTSFASHSRGVESGCSNAVALDVDLDGNLDIVAQTWSNGATVLFGDGQGMFPADEPLATGAQGYNDLKSADVTGDGFPDLVLVSGQSTSFFVYPHNGIDGFAAPHVYQSPVDVWHPEAVALADFNRDGLTDVAVSTSGNRPTSAVHVYIQQGNGRLGNPVRLASYDIPTAMVAIDLDRDGDEDLLVGHRAWGTIGRYMNDGRELGSELLASAPFNGFSSALAAGDVNGDGCADALAADHNSGLVILYGRGCASPAAEADFDGDGRSDVVWRRSTTGHNAIWRSANYALQLPVTQVTNSAWRIVGVGDFNADGDHDLLWRNTATGANAIWNSARYQSQQPVTGVTNMAWTIAGTGDFNGDGREDILWQHDRTGTLSTWFSGNFLTQRVAHAMPGGRWRIAGIGDFDGDGKDDVLWRDAVGGSNMVWRSANPWLRMHLVGVSNAQWRVAATGDFDGDHKADIMWRNALTGANAIWLGGRYARQLRLPDMAGTAWQIEGTGDYDGDGRSDLLWRNDTTGENLIWKGGQAGNPLPMTDVTIVDWKIVP